MRRKPSRRNTRFGIESLDARLLLSTLVAMVDTGVDLNSSADAPYYDLTTGYNAYTEQVSTADGSNVADNSAGIGNHGHGSTVADSIVLGIKDAIAQPGAAGADVKIMPIRVTSDSGNLDGGSYGAVVRGIFYAAYHHASAINVSIVFLSLSDQRAHVPRNPDPAYTKTNPTLQDAIDYARSKGAVVVTGAGNNHYDLDSTGADKNGYYPLHLFPTFNTGPNLIVAASTEPSGDLTSVSNFGATHVTLGAPAIQNATSYAAGYITGVTGVIAALNPGLSADGVAGLIKSSAQVYPQLQGKISTGAVISPANAVAASVVVKPTVVSSAAAFPQTVSGSSTKLAVLGMSTSGESGLTYTWSVLSGPAVTFGPAGANGTNAGKNITASFSQPGSYTFQARISTATGASVTSEVTVNVTSVATSVEVSPSSVPVDGGKTQAFSALARDQFGGPLAPQPQFVWSVQSGGAGGAIDASGKYTAPASGSGQDIVRAAAGPVAGTSVVRVETTSTRGPVAIDAGSTIGAGAFQADIDVVGGNTGSTSRAIDTSGALDPAPAAVYQSERWSGESFTYTIPGLDPGASYTARLHFAETFYNAAGLRRFNVTINGARVLEDFDILDAAGGADRAVTRSLAAKADADGKITITFTNVFGGASCSGVEVIPGAPVATPPSPPSPGSPTIEAVSLGQDGHDVANIRDLLRAVPGPDGLQDVHIRLSNLPEDTPITRVEVNRTGGNGLYRSDGAPWSWSTVVSRASTAPGRYSAGADVFFQPNSRVDDDDHEYQVYIYLAGQTLPVLRFVKVTDDPSLAYRPADPPPSIEAISLGQDGSDFANIFDFSRAVPGPDGLQDVHIRLSDLPQDQPIERVQVNRSGGGGLYRSDGSLWAWSTVVARGSTPSGLLSDIADVYFQPNPGVVDANQEYQLDIVFAGQTRPVSLFVHVTDDPLLRKKKPSAT